jgi:hypothetical protein
MPGDLGEPALVSPGTPIPLGSGPRSQAARQESSSGTARREVHRPELDRCRILRRSVDVRLRQPLEMGPRNERDQNRCYCNGRCMFPRHSVDGVGSFSMRSNFRIRSCATRSYPGTLIVVLVALLALAQASMSGLGDRGGRNTNQSFSGLASIVIAFSSRVILAFLFVVDALSTMAFPCPGLMRIK